MTRSSLSSAFLTADIITFSLSMLKKLNDSGKFAETEFYVSDYTQSFEKSGKYFFGEKVNLTLNDIWPSK